MTGASTYPLERHFDRLSIFGWLTFGAMREIPCCRRPVVHVLHADWGQAFAAWEGYVQVTQQVMQLAADGGIDSITDGIKPDWAVFGAIGSKAKIIVGVIMAGAVLFLLGSAVVGAVHIRVGNNQHNTMETKKGQTMLGSSLLGLFAVASMTTLFGIVYGFGI